MARQFEFNTGVRHLGQDRPALAGEHQRWRDGVKVILFYADVPANAKFLVASAFGDLNRSKSPDIIVAPITGGLGNKFGYFRLPRVA